MCQGKIEVHPSSIMEIRDDNVRAALILIQTPWLHTSPQASGKDEGVPGSDHLVMQTHATRAHATCQQVHALRVHSRSTLRVGANKKATRLGNRHTKTH